MPSQLQGRLGRRLIALLVLGCIGVALWHGFGTDAPPPSAQHHHHHQHLHQLDESAQKPPGAADVNYVASSFDWKDAPVYFPVDDIQSPPRGAPRTFPVIQSQQPDVAHDSIAAAHKKTIKAKFVKSWEAYKKLAWTRDELMPLSAKGKTSFSGWSAQLVDALDTLWIMDLKDEFSLAVKEIATIDWAKTTDKTINVFEVTIRYLGGLISGYELSQEPVLLTKAVELGDTLYAAFDTPNRMPPLWLDYRKAKMGEQHADLTMSIANGGSMALEFTRLSQLTGNPKYYDATERVKQFLYSTQNKTQIPGLWPRIANWRDQIMDEWLFTIGGGADSVFEYLPKMHALLGGLDPEYEQMTILALEAVRDFVLYRPKTPHNERILFAGNAVNKRGGIQRSAEMQHLTCFAGGMYALAGRLLSREDFVDLGSQLTAGCVWAYDAFETNIMPEIVELAACEKLTGACEYKHRDLPKGRGPALPEGFLRVRDARYQLRPEAIESVFYMWRITGDQVWRDAAWRMWQGIVKETETELAFASVEDVTVHASPKVDSMETFWMSETLKYFYLIFDDSDEISLDEWVLNTEAHPFRRPKQG